MSKVEITEIIKVETTNIHVVDKDSYETNGDSIIKALETTVGEAVKGCDNFTYSVQHFVRDIEEGEDK